MRRYFVGNAASLVNMPPRANVGLCQVFAGLDLRLSTWAFLHVVLYGWLPAEKKMESGSRPRNGIEGEGFEEADLKLR